MPATPRPQPQGRLDPVMSRRRDSAARTSPGPGTLPGPGALPGAGTLLEPGALPGPEALPKPGTSPVRTTPVGPATSLSRASSLEPATSLKRAVRGSRRRRVPVRRPDAPHPSSGRGPVERRTGGKAERRTSRRDGHAYPWAHARGNGRARPGQARACGHTQGSRSGQEHGNRRARPGQAQACGHTHDGRPPCQHGRACRCAPACCGCRHA